MVRLTALLAMLLIVAAPRAACGDEATWPAVLAEALAAYDEGMALRRGQPEAAEAAFARAAERFAYLESEGLVNGPLLYDLGNAYMHAVDLGRAIAAYRRAELLMPGDDRLQENLAYARSLCRTRIEAAGQRQLVEALLTWHAALTLTTRSALAGGAWIGFWLILAMMQLRRVPGGRSFAGAMGVLWLALGASVAVDMTGGGAARHGVLVENDVDVRKGGGLSYELQYAEPLHAGVELRVRTDRGAWLEVELPNGRTGWVESAAVERF